MKKKVVVTGIGSVSPLGLNTHELDQSLKEGRSGISLIEHFDTSAFSVKFAGQVKNFDCEKLDFDQKILSRLDPFMLYSLQASEEALQMSGLGCDPLVNKSKVGVIIGSGIGGLSTIEQNHQKFSEKGPRRIAPSFIPSTIINMPAGHLSIKYGFSGPTLATTTACTTGTHAIAQAYDMIMAGYVDAVVAGSGEKASTELGIGGFASARALSTRNDEPTKASRPWDKNRDGFVLSDGAATIILEEKEHALKRGAHILAELSSAGYSSDAFHMTQPHPQGLGASQAMDQALERANLNPEDICHINTHSTSTVAGDMLELKALEKTFKSHCQKVHLSATKSMTGHLLGAAGSLEAVISILSLQGQYVPPTINVTEPEDYCSNFNINFSQKALYTPLKRILSNSFGFGGTNGCLIFQQA